MMSIENMVDFNRKPNADYSKNIKDEEKSAGCEKLPANLFAENLAKSKRDKTPNTCQNNADASNELADNHLRSSGLDKKLENIHGISTESNGKRQKTVCYDFKKGICRRRFCRYPHVMNTDQVVFCHDFQNNGCFRANCRFIHRSIEDEDHYRIYGVFPILTERPQPAANMNQPPEHVLNAPPSHAPPPPLPQQHLNYYPNRDNIIANQQPPNQPVFTQQNSTLSLASRRRSFGMADSNIEMKRPHLEDIRSQAVSTSTYNTQNTDASHQCRFVDANSVGQAVNQPPTSVPNTVGQVQPPPPVTSVVISEDVINIYRLYEEHNLLRRRVELNEEISERLKNSIQELRATNSYLLQQNEQLRRQTQCSCTNTIVNPVTLTTASQQSATPQVLNAVSIAPVQMQATPIVSIASIGQPQTQIIASTPLAITANTSQGQQLALASTQQAGQILGTPQITLATAPSMGITMNTSQPLAMSANATQPIISYPVMTHSILPH